MKQDVSEEINEAMTQKMLAEYAQAQSIAAAWRCGFP